LLGRAAPAAALDWDVSFGLDLSDSLAHRFDLLGMTGLFPEGPVRSA
jgi:hypothetical protein